VGRRGAIVSAAVVPPPTAEIPAFARDVARAAAPDAKRTDPAAEATRRLDREPPSSFRPAPLDHAAIAELPAFAREAARAGAPDAKRTATAAEATRRLDREPPSSFRLAPLDPAAIAELPAFAREAARAAAGPSHPPSSGWEAYCASAQQRKPVE
jgi:hypothetical protein